MRTQVQRVIGNAISVITLTRGRPDMVARAIASVRAQDHTGPIEHVVVIDDDPDTERMLSQFPRHDGVRLVVLPQARPEAERQPGNEARGSVYPRLARLVNAGIAHAVSPWIAFLDDDNEYDPGHLSSLFACVTERDVEAAHSARQMLWPSGEPYLEEIFPGAPNTAEGRRIFELMCERGVWVRGTHILQDRVDAQQGSCRNSTVIEADDPVFLVDQNLWLVRRRLLVEHPIPEQFTQAEIEANTCPDDKMLEMLVRLGVRIEATRQPTVRYYLGGVSNGDEQPAKESRRSA